MFIKPYIARGPLETKTARVAARLENAVNVRAEVEDKRHAAEERTAKLRAMRLAQEKPAS